MIQRLTFLLLHLTSGVRYWYRRKLTGPGRFVLGGIVVSAVVGIDTDLTMTYQIFALLLALFLVSLLSSVIFKIRFNAVRALPPFVTAGEGFEYRISITNRGGNTKKGLILVDSLADPRPSYDEFMMFNGNIKKRPGLGFRTHRRWQALISKNRNGDAPEIKLDFLASRQDKDLSIELVPQRRGYLHFTGVTLAVPDPLGLVKTLATVVSDQTLPVLPKRYALPRINLPGTLVYQHGGVTLASSKGDFEEFIGLRDYHPGDPLQRIHWKSFARVGYPVVKEYQDEFFERHALVLDTFSDIEHDHILEEAVSIAASFICTAETQENLLELMFVGTDTYSFTAGPGQLHTESMLRILAGVQLCANNPLSELRKAILERRMSLAGCIIILLDWDKPRRDLVDELNALGLPLLVLVVCDEPERIRSDVPWLHALRVGNIEQGLQKL